MAKALNFVLKESFKNRYVWTRRIFLKTNKKNIRAYSDTCGRPGLIEEVIECKKHFNQNKIHKQGKEI